MNLPIILLAMLGFFISLYAYIIEQRIKKNPEYKPACDLSDKISCSKAINSSYAKVFIYPIALIGILYYLLTAILAFFEFKTLLLISAISSVIISLLLAYILYIKIKTFCLICTTIYIINFLILFFVILHF